MPTLELSPSPDSPGRARRFVTGFLRDWGVGVSTIEDAALLATELVTNAVIHARTPMLLDIGLEEDVIRIAVSDSDAGRPTMRPQNKEASTGRGLYVVDQIATDWEVIYGDGSKTVTCSLVAGDTGTNR
jgi:anti-sigma regulatory factor (Ser/Thr protein kinase)